MGFERDLTAKLSLVTFYCSSCSHRFSAEPDVVIDSGDGGVHPWEYFADCEICGERCAQIYWERNLMRAVGKQTGPKTPSGKAASAANGGQLTDEQKSRTRFNGLKHGRYLKQRSYFDARPGQYAFCKSCSVPYETCAENTVCITQTAHMTRMIEAYESKDPSKILDMMAHKQAHFQSILDMAILAVINEGASIHQPVYEKNKDGEVTFPEYMDSSGEMRHLIEIKAHPLLRFIADAFQKNTMSLADFSLTPKVQDADETGGGYLDAGAQHGSDSNDYQRRQALALENLSGLIENSRQKAARDPVLIEHGDG